MHEGCRECPFLEIIQEDINKTRLTVLGHVTEEFDRQDENQRSIEIARDYVTKDYSTADPDEVARLQRKLEDEITVLEEKMGDSREAAVDYLDAVHSKIDYLETLKERALASCKSGPFTEKRYKIFGETVLKCGSRISKQFRYY